MIGERGFLVDAEERVPGRSLNRSRDESTRTCPTKQRRFTEIQSQLRGYQSSSGRTPACCVKAAEICGDALRDAQRLSHSSLAHSLILLYSLALRQTQTHRADSRQQTLAQT
eukprot:2603680-Rhodomonas_salina.5